MSYLIYGIIFFGFPVGATIWGYFNLKKHPEQRASAQRTIDDQWGSF